MKTTKSVISNSLLKDLDADPFYKVCALSVVAGHGCEGRITREHAVIHGGNKVQEKWAIIPICAKAHGVDQFQDNHEMRKDLHVWIALSRATEQQVREMCGEGMFKVSHPLQKSWPWLARRTRLLAKFGPYSEQEAIKRYVPPIENKDATVGSSAAFSMAFTKEQLKMIDDCVEFYGARDMLFTKSQMVDKMIRAAHEAIRPHIKAEKESLKKAKKEIAPDRKLSARF